MAGKNVLGNTLDLIGQAIVSGRYLPSTSIPPEPLLCEEYGISRTVVREAVKSLVAKGLLVTAPSWAPACCRPTIGTGSTLM